MGGGGGCYWESSNCVAVGIGVGESSTSSIRSKITWKFPKSTLMPFSQSQLTEIRFLTLGDCPFFRDNSCQGQSLTPLFSSSISKKALPCRTSRIFQRSFSKQIFDTFVYWAIVALREGDPPKEITFGFIEQILNIAVENKHHFLASRH